MDRLVNCLRREFESHTVCLDKIHAAVLEGQDLSVTPSRVSLVPGLCDTLCIPSLSRLQNEGAGTQAQPAWNHKPVAITRRVFDSEALMIWFVLGCVLGAFLGTIIVGSLFIAAIQYGIGRGLGW